MYGYGCFISANGRPASGVDADALSFITTAGITDATQKSAINKLVLDLKTNSLWSKMIALYPIVGGNATSHSYNLKNTSQYQLTFSSGWSHSSLGMTGNGASTYANTGVNPTNFNLNSFSLGIYLRTDSFTGWDIGCSTSRRCYIAPSTSGNSYFASNSDNQISATLSSTKGFFVVSRENSSLVKAYRNAVDLGSDTSTSFYESYNIYLGAVNRNNTAYVPSNKMQSLSFIASGITSSEVTLLNSIVNIYQTSLSRNV